MIKLDKTIIVEGRYDKARLSTIFDADIIETGGFQIFSDPKLLGLIKRLAAAGGIIVATDSDKAGFTIRQYIASAVPPNQIIHVYIPDIYGKERRKTKPSAEGKLGVEGMENDMLLEVFKQAGALSSGSSNKSSKPITKLDLYELGISGGENSAEIRTSLKQLLSLPERLGTNALLGTLNKLMTYSQLQELMGKLSLSERSCKDTHA